MRSMGLLRDGRVEPHDLRALTLHDEALDRTEELAELPRGRDRQELAEDARIVVAKIQPLARVLFLDHEIAAEVPADLARVRAGDEEDPERATPALRDEALEELRPGGESDEERR